nr:rust resistance kinase Lr10-like [Ipomoea batatas]
MGKGYFLHLPILVLFFTLGYGYDPNKCLPRKCGNNNGPEISFPFRLKNMPPECGYPGFELLCTDKGETAMELPFPLLNATQQPPFPVKFLIESIHYESQEIIISGADVCLPQLLPILNLSASASPFSFEDLSDFSIFSCSTHRNITASVYIYPIACLTKPAVHFIYAGAPFQYLYTATDLISCTKMFDISVPYSFIAQDNNEFRLSWTGPRCRLKNNSTADDVDDCYGKSSLTGPLTKLKVAGEVLGSFLVVVIVLVTYRIYSSNKMKKEDQMLEAEEPPSMPPNPFTSTDPSKAKANKPGKLFTSGLEIISELE